MWHSSRGDRTLQGAEAALVASAIEMMIDALVIHVDDDHVAGQPLPDCDSGIAVIDRMSACQRIGLFHQLASYLLTETSRTLKLTANADAGIAAIFVEIRDQVAIEVDLRDELSGSEAVRWRQMIVETLHELDDLDASPDDPPSVHTVDLNVWEDVVDQLVSGILWDRDFEMLDGFLDADPQVTSQRCKLMGIDRQYFSEITPDPRPEEAWVLMRETRDIIESTLA